jgi:hypothetical protein
MERERRPDVFHFTYHPIVPLSQDFLLGGMITYAVGIDTLQE